MDKEVRFSLGVLVSVLLVTLGVHSAQAAGPYIVLDAGASHWDVHSKDVNDGSVSGELDVLDLSYGIRLGYAVNQYLAIEAGYRDLGEAELSGTSIGGSFWCDGDVRATLSGYSLEGAVLGKLPVTPRFSLFASAGASRWDSKVKLKDSCDSVSASDDGVSLTLGIGAEYSITDRFGIRGEVRRYADVADEFDVHTASVGAVISF